MVAMMLASYEDVRKARQCVHDLAQAAGISDPSAAVLVTGELGNNCVEHGGPAPGLLRIGCKPGALFLQFENPCTQRPEWRSQKPLAVEGFRVGGYGFPLVQAMTSGLSRRWADGHVVVRAEFRTDGCPIGEPWNVHRVGGACTVAAESSSTNDDRSEGSASGPAAAV